MLTEERLNPPIEAASDWTIPQHWERFTAEEHAVWDLLFERQRKMLHGRVVKAFEEGLDVLRLSHPGIPDLEELNDRLHQRTGWTVVSVPGLIPDDVFFRHLSLRQFPAGNFIRKRAQLDYLEEPDVFHDVFGHVPLLANPAVGDFMQRLGEHGLESMDAGALHRLARLYWYTVEFGLAREGGDLKIYGAGIVSSFGESHFSLESPKPKRRPFDMREVLRTRYRSDAFQEGYFIIDSFEALLEDMLTHDFDALYAEAADAPDLDIAR
jgi:phenylalanine-4-hydroxylase